MARRKCQASHLGSCSDKISREHYVSENLLKEISNLEASGLKWLKGEVKKDEKYLPKPQKIEVKKGKFKEVLHFFY